MATEREMADQTDSLSSRQGNLSVLSGQGSLAIMGWTLAGPSIVLTYIAIALGLPASNALVITLSALLIAATGLVVLVGHNYQLANSIYLHATVLFVVTIALKGLTSAQTLHCSGGAKGAAHRLSVSKSICRVLVVGISLFLAALAHAGAINMLVVVIIACAMATVLTGLRSTEDAVKPA